MTKMDKLLERMTQRRIEGAVLINDQPARFSVAGRETNGGVLPMAQLYGLVQEVTPADLWWELAQDSNFDFPYHSPYGTFKIAIERANGSFQVCIRPDFSEQAQEAQALCNNGVLLGQTARHAEALKVLEQTIHRYNGVPDPDVQAQVARACRSRGSIFFFMGAEHAALAAFEETVQRFGGNPHPAVQKQVAKALLNKAATFFNLGQRPDALDVYEDLMNRFAGHAHPALREVAAEARRERDALRRAHELT